MKKLISIFTVLISFWASAQTLSISGDATVCQGVTETYTVSVSPNPPAGCATYFWVVTNGQLLSGQGTNSISVKWNNVGSGSVRADVDSEPGEPPTGGCTFINEQETKNITIQATISGTLTASGSGSHCPGEQVTLTASVTGDAQFLGWYHLGESNPFSTNLVVVTSTPGTDVAKASLQNACVSQTLSELVPHSAPVVYNLGTAYGDRTVSQGANASGEVGVTGSNALIDEWWWKVGTGSWTKKADATTTTDHTFAYNEVFNQETKFKARILKQCTGEADSFLPEITISMGPPPNQTCPGDQVSYTYQGTEASDPTCMTYFWQDPALGTIISGQNSKTVTIRWDSPGTSSVIVNADSEPGPGNSCPAIAETESFSVPIATPATGTLSVASSYNPSTVFCAADESTLTATITGNAQSGWIGWHNSSGTLIDSNLSTVVSSTGTYTAKYRLLSACNDQMLIESVTLNGPVTYNLGTAVGDRTVNQGAQASGEVSVTGSNAPIDRWEKKIGAGSWQLYQTVADPNDHAVTYNEQFLSETKFRARVIKQCPEESFTYLPEITISMGAPLPTACPFEVITLTYPTSHPACVSYFWLVDGGVIQSGQNTEEITVFWNTPGAKTITVTADGEPPSCSVAVNESEIFSINVLATAVGTVSGSSDHIGTFCAADQATLTGTITGDAQWLGWFDGVGTQLDPDLDRVATVSATGTYWARARLLSSCNDDIIQDFVTLEYIPYTQGTAFGSTTVNWGHQASGTVGVNNSDAKINAWFKKVGTGSWQLFQTVSQANESNHSLNYSEVFTEETSYKARIKKQCPEDPESFLPTITIFTTPKPASYCPGDTEVYTSSVPQNGTCVSYSWTMQTGNGTIISDPTLESVTVQWDGPDGLGTVSVSADAEPGGGCTALSVTESFDAYVGIVAIGDLLLNSTQSSALCSGDQVTLSANLTTPDAVNGWLGWFYDPADQTPFSTSTSINVSAIDTYYAKTHLQAECTDNEIVKSISVFGPTTYSQGIAIGDRKVYRNIQTSGELRIIHSDAKIDEWQWRVGTGDWQAFAQATSEDDHIMTYNEIFTEDTEFRAHIIKQCPEELDAYLPTITIETKEYIPDFNSIAVNTYDSGTVLTGKSIKYFDYLGDLAQSQILNFDIDEVFASEPLRDNYRREVGQTLSAPLGRNYFEYKNELISHNGSKYTYANFDKPVPDPVDKTTIGTLGHYYSEFSTEDFVAETKYPYVLTDFYEDGTEENKSSSLPGDFHYLESDNVGKRKLLPVLDGELRFYDDIRDLLVGQNDPPTKIVKQVGIDAIDNEFIVYADQNQNTIATAVSGGPAYTTSITKANDGITEIHIPKGVTATFSGYDEIIDLDTEQPVAGTSLSQGFYSVEKTTGSISYMPNYTDFTYNFYDNKGRLIASMTPNGTKEIIDQAGVGSIVDKADLPYTTLYEYDFQGRLIKMTEPDAGESRYVYRKDGQIRFSQSAEQKNDTQFSRFSVTSYDDLGRPIESMEYHVDNTNPAVKLFDTYYDNPDGNALAINETGLFATPSIDDRIDWIKSHYDIPMLPSLPAQFTGAYALTQHFVAGAVSSTESEEVQSWYSYDDQGRVTWFLQYFKQLSIDLGSDMYFLIQYKYDFLENVTKVAFQPQTYGSTTSEAFWHKYEYDANQRLSIVSTSVDNSDWYEHARYTYYNHGPLKRVMLAQDKDDPTKALQGIDYTYTAQGWLKAINHPVKGEDPGGDGITGMSNENVSADAFGMTLEYFEQDYANSGVPGLIPLDIDDQNYPQQPTGNIRSVVFPGASNGDYVVKGQATNATVSSFDPNQPIIMGKESVRLKPGFSTNGQSVKIGVGSYSVNTATNVEAYAYTYDHKNQLTTATFGKSSDFGSADNAYNVTMGGMDGPASLDPYDANGNIQGIERFGENPNNLKHDFKFNYEAGTNKLLSVSGYIDNIGYDDSGQVTSINYTDDNRPDILIEYDVTGKVTKVSDVATQNPLVEFAYDDRGFRVMKRVGNLEEWYVRDASGQVMAIYHTDNQATPQKFAQIELPIYGASRLGIAYKNPDHYKYIYSLTDHLGNVRALVTKLGLQATATIEVDTDPNGVDEYEAQYFDNLGTRHLDAVYNYPDPLNGSYGALTNPSQPVGPTTTLRVKAGDEISLEVFSKYTLPGGFDPAALTSGIIDALTGNVNSIAVNVDGTGLADGVYDALNGASTAVTGTSGQPKAYLQYILLDESFGYLNSGYVPVTGAGLDANGWETLTLSDVVTEDGFLFAYIVNESTANVYFDHFTFSIQGTRMIRSTDYYPFGAVAKVWNNPDQTQQEKYRHGYQGQFAEKDTITGFSSFQLRQYDPVIGRWLTTDPYRQYASSYLGMGNNPTNQIDPNGGYSKFWAKWHAFWTPGVNASDIYEVDGEWGFNTVDYDLGGVVWNVGNKYENYGYGNPGAGIIKPHEPNFFGSIYNQLDESPSHVEFTGKLIYHTVDDLVLTFQLGANRRHLDGSFAWPKEIESAGVGTLFLLNPITNLSAGIPSKTLNAGQFNSLFKGTGLNSGKAGVLKSYNNIARQYHNAMEAAVPVFNGSSLYNAAIETGN